MKIITPDEESSSAAIAPAQPAAQTEQAPPPPAVFQFGAAPTKSGTDVAKPEASAVAPFTFGAAAAPPLTTKSQSMPVLFPAPKATVGFQFAGSAPTQPASPTAATGSSGAFQFTSTTIVDPTTSFNFGGLTAPAANAPIMFASMPAAATGHSDPTHRTRPPPLTARRRKAR